MDSCSFPTVKYTLGEPEPQRITDTRATALAPLPSVTVNVYVCSPGDGSMHVRSRVPPTTAPDASVQRYVRNS